MAEYPILYDANKAVPSATSHVGDNALGLTIPDSVLSGTMRGTQAVGAGGSYIDSANNRFIIKNPNDGSTVGIGTIPGTTTNEFGFFAVDKSGNLIMKIVNGTWYVYDITNNKNIMQTGKLPDATYGWALAKVGSNVSDGF